TEVATAHPLMRWVALKDLNIARASRFALGPGDVAVASSLREPIMATRERAGRKTVAIGFPLQRSDLPLRVAFPVLLINALDGFAGGDSELAASYPTGHTWQLRSSDGAPALTVRGPDGVIGRAPVHGGRATWFGTRAGWYELSSGSGPSRLLAA